jgi:uncharacterized protein YjbJ (UPF0337 family)
VGLGAWVWVVSGRGIPLQRVATNPPINPQRTKEHPMSGTADKATGRIKQAAGDLTDNDELKNDGKKDEAAGKAKDAVESVKDKAGDAIDKIKDASK